MSIFVPERRGNERPNLHMRIPSGYQAGYEAARVVDARLAGIYIHHTSVGDPAADRVVADLAATHTPAEVHPLIAAALRDPFELPDGLPDSLKDLVREVSVIPDWYDPELAQAATRGFIRNSNIIPAALAGAAIVEGFSTLISKSFRIRGRITQNGVRRLRQNLLHLADQYLPGGMEPGGDGWRLTLRIRLVHAQSRMLLEASDEWDAAAHGVPISAANVMLASTTFSARLLQHARRLGAKFSDMEWEGYVHVWRYTAWIMGVPEALLFEDYEAAQRGFEIGMLCEPVPDEDAIIMANSIVNSAPLLLGVKDPKERRPFAMFIYQVCRELVGDELADHFLFPPSKRLKQVPLLWLKHRMKRGAMKWIPGFHRLNQGYDYMEMLQISNVGDFEQSYRLPTTLHDEASQPW